MGALAHYIEREGISTTQVSLVKEHTLKINPPRALWAPFELGRPFGAPDEPDFQRRVLKAALKLLERDSGPVLEDFPEEAPGSASEEDTEGWACVVNFSEAVKEITVEEDPLGALKQEMDRLRSWYDLGVEKRNGRTTVGISEVDLDILSEYFVSLIDDVDSAPPRTDIPRFQMVKLAADDLKAYYFEAAAAQPGNATDKSLADWYYGETAIGKILALVNESCRLSGDEVLMKMSDRRLLPIHQKHHKLAVN
ncbi:MAG: hypothetical protein O3A84_04170 [Proteobacteria bacterium]|nr:hypothetical protein [Pseudomonadota bacterium]